MLNSLYKLFEHKCVCTHPSYKNKNPPSVSFITILKSSFSNQAEIPVRVM